MRPFPPTKDSGDSDTCAGRPTPPGEYMRSLPDTSHEHHELIEPHVDRLPELAEMIGRVTPEVFSATFQEECSFIVGRLVPHMEAIETSLYGRLEVVMDKRHSMAPMRQEHERLRALFASLCEYSELVADEQLTEGDQVGLRRVLYRLYAMLKVHLAEEELYLGVLDRNLSVEEKAPPRTGHRPRGEPSRCSERLSIRSAFAAPRRLRGTER